MLGKMMCRQVPTLPIGGYATVCQYTQEVNESIAFLIKPISFFFSNHTGTLKRGCNCANASTTVFNVATTVQNSKFTSCNTDRYLY